MADPKTVSREDDFRDYEQRDIRDGWPYADKDEDPRAGKNAPYGAPEANFDQLDDEGVELSDDPALRDDVEGAPMPFSDGTDEAIDDDALEDRIVQALEDEAGIDLSALEITIRDGIAHIEGAVDSEDERRRLVALVRRLKGVRGVEARALLARGVDSHIPPDADE